MPHGKRWWGVLGWVMALTMMLASAAWACVPEGTSKKLNVNPLEAKPGQEITVAAAPNASKSPITVRLNATDGPVLGTLAVDGDPIPGEGFKATFKLPADLNPGKSVLIAVQEGVNDWQPSLLRVVDERGMVPDVPQSPAAAKAAAPAPDESLPRGAAGIVALAVAGLTIASVARSRRDSQHGRNDDRTGPLQWVQPSALALVAGAAAYAALRPRLDGSLVVLGVIAIASGLLGRGRTHFIPVGLVLGCWGLAVWLVSENVIPRDRSQAAAVTGLGLGMLLSAKLARTPQQRTTWLYTGVVCTFNAGLSYYVLYDLPVAFARWSAFTIFLLGWAAWEQYRASRMVGSSSAQGVAADDAEDGQSVEHLPYADPSPLAPSVR